ncbi:class A beta-lactamase-related serine hydrolase [Colidextribacter sp. OB.20]|uniref:serine hydrolase domain-containing protein n=1 Tax=Colidextribacter sp. OB.20 TaxID=2304568 RepID=UPI00136D32E3|nr:serine hydrolase domain-containing protein [Colidextribacter sp. OB.20]NBI09333.1 class A beta-lactamase-related serine hydrolase [Colidextribacter sp. OB.20]
MYWKLSRLGAYLLALALTLTACAGTPAASSQPDGSSAGSGPGQPALPVIAPEPEPEPEPPEPGPVLTQEDVDGALAQVMERYKAAGVTVATVERGQLSQAGAWGWAVKNEREMTPDTKIRIASISKVVVAMCALAMAEDGLLDLDAPLSTYWGAKAVNPYSSSQPTVQDLMTHTSSLKNLDPVRGLSRLRGLLNSRSSWRTMEPGNGGYWAYSNFGVSVLGTTLELAAQQTLDDYLQKRFLEPMDIRASFLGGRLEENEVATLYTTGGIGRTAAAHAGQSVPTEIGGASLYFAGGYTTSAVDMAKLVSVLVNDGVYKEPGYTCAAVSEDAFAITQDGFAETRFLSEASVENMETPRFTVNLADYASFEQCLILRRQEDVLGQDVLYYHTGSAYGVFSLMTYNPETQNGVVVITTGASRNMNEHGMYALCYDLMELLYEKMEGSPV